MTVLLVAGPLNGQHRNREPLDSLTFRLESGELVLYRYHSTSDGVATYIYSGIVFELRQDVVEI